MRIMPFINLYIRYLHTTKTALRIAHKIHTLLLFRQLKNKSEKIKHKLANKKCNNAAVLK